MEIGHTSSQQTQFLSYTYFSLYLPENLDAKVIISKINVR